MLICDNMIHRFVERQSRGIPTAKNHRIIRSPYIKLKHEIKLEHEIKQQNTVNGVIFDCLFNHYKDKVNVCMTSWTKRINLVPNTIKQLLNQTIKPKMIYLTLSSDEFTDKSIIPQELFDLEKENENFTIHWVKENTKTMKKVFPVLEFIDEGDVILTMDDDIVFNNDLIEKIFTEYCKHGCSNIITPFGSSYGCNMFFGLGCCSPCNMFSRKAMNGYDKFIDNNILTTYEDDPIYTILGKLNGYTTLKINCISVNFIAQNTKFNGYCLSRTSPRVANRISELFKLNMADIVNKDNTIDWDTMTFVKRQSTNILDEIKIDFSYAIATLTDNNYFDYTLHLIRSFISNNRWFDGDILIYQIEELDSTKVKLLNSIYKKIVIKNINKKDYADLIKKHKNSAAKQHYSNCFYKYEILDNDYDRIIFFDSDIIVKDSIKELFLLKYDFAACLEIGHRDYNFNGGVLCFSKKYINKDFKNELINFTSNLRNLKFQEQDALNIYFKNNFYNLPLLYNAYLCNVSKAPINYSDVKVVHYWDKPHTLTSLFKEYIELYHSYD